MIAYYEKVGRDYVAVNDSGHVVGVLKMLPIEIPQREVTPLKTSQNPFKHYTHLPVEAMFTKWVSKK